MNKGDRAKWSGFKRVMRVTEGLELLFENTSSEMEVEEIATIDALECVLAQDIVAGFNLPGFRRSAMDGYALKARNTFGANETNPLELEVVGISEIGDTSAPDLGNNQAIRISTGAPLPSSADAVIKIEDCEEIDEHTIEVYASINPGKNVAEEDEDVKKGETLLRKGDLIKPWDIAMIISLGLENVKVYKKPKVAVISTGSELVPTGSDRVIGQVYDSNRPALVAWTKSLGADIVINETCKDDLATIQNRLENVIGKVDLVITSGGTSVGKKDFMVEAVESMGEIWAHGIAIRPGKPLILGQIQNSEHKTPIIALPGYPLAAFLNFELFVIPLLGKWTGRKYYHKKEKVKLLQKVPSTTGIRDFVRLTKTDEGAKILRITGAGILSSLVRADYILEIPEDVEGYPAGSIVEVRKLRD